MRVRFGLIARLKFATQIQPCRLFHAVDKGSNLRTRVDVTCLPKHDRDVEIQTLRSRTAGHPSSSADVIG